MIYAIQILFLLLNLSTAIYQARLFKANKKISHALWAAAYCALVAGVWFWQHNLLLVVALLVERMPVLNTALNLIREKPFFYVGTESKLDQIMGKFYPVVFCICIIAIIILQFFL